MKPYTYTELDDRKLASLAREDHDAFETLYQRYVTPVYRYCYARTDNAADAEDLTAQTFLAALESIGGYRGLGSFPGWLFSIARRKCADFYRGAYAAQAVLVESPETVELAAGDEEDPDDHLYLQAILDCIERMLPQISPDRVEALRLRFWADLSMREIAKVMRRSEAAVKMLVSRAISDLKERCSA